MRLVQYSKLLRKSLALAGLPADELQATDATLWRGWIEDALGAAWQAEKWPEICRTEQRYIRALYDSATTYAAGAEVYYLDEGKTYVALRSTTGNAPTDTAYWAVSATSYSAADYSSASTYAVGDSVWYPTTAKWYAAHTAGTNHAPTNTSYWGELVPLDPYISLTQTGKTEIAEVFDVYEENPWVFTNPRMVPHQLGANGIQVLDGYQTGWVHFRLVAPSLDGEVFDTTVAYAVGDQVYYSGDYYDCVATTTAGQTPVSQPTKWSLVELPEFLANYAAQHAYCLWLKSDGQGDKSQTEFQLAAAEMTRLCDKLFRQQGQISQPRVQTR